MGKPRLTWFQRPCQILSSSLSYYCMNKMVMSLTKLMKKLQKIEGILKDQRDIHITVKGSSSSSSKKKITLQSPLSRRESSRGKENKSKRQGKYFLYGKKGHMKKEHPFFLKRHSNMHHSLLIESYLVVNSTNSQWIDFGAIDHVYNSLHGFQLWKDRDMYLTLASEARLSCMHGKCYPYIR